MRFSCKSCGATFQTASGASPKAALACPACGGEMVASAEVVELRADRVPTRRYDLDELRARLEVEREESARARGAPRTVEQIWFAAVQGRQVGPLTPAGLQGLRARGQLQAATLVWREGWPAWVAAEAVAELRPVLGLPEEKPGWPFPVLPAAPAPPPLDATSPRARAAEGDATDPGAPNPGGWGPSGAAAGDPLQPSRGDLTSPGRPSAMILPPPSAGPVEAAPPAAEGRAIPAGETVAAADAREAAPRADAPAQPAPAAPRAAAVEATPVAGAADGAPAAARVALKEAAAPPPPPAAASAGEAAAAPARRNAERTIPDAKLPAFPRPDTVPDAVQPEFFEPQPLETIRPALSRAAAGDEGPRGPPALPHAAGDVAALTAAIASAAPAVAQEARASREPAAGSAAPGDAGRAGGEGAQGPAAIARRRGRSRPPGPAGGARFRGSTAPDGSAAAAGGAAAPSAPAPSAPAPSAPSGVKVLELSGAPSAEAPRGPGQPPWFASAEEGREVDPRRMALALLLVVALVVLALLVKAR